MKSLSMMCIITSIFACAGCGSDPLPLTISGKEVETKFEVEEEAQPFTIEEKKIVRNYYQEIINNIEKRGYDDLRKKVDVDGYGLRYMPFPTGEPYKGKYGRAVVEEMLKDIFLRKIFLKAENAYKAVSRGLVAKMCISKNISAWKGKLNIYALNFVFVGEDDGDGVAIAVQRVENNGIWSIQITGFSMVVNSLPYSSNQKLEVFNTHQ